MRDLTTTVKLDTQLTVDILTKGKEVVFVFAGFPTKEEAKQWATLQHATYVLEEKELCTQH